MLRFFKTFPKLKHREAFTFCQYEGVEKRP